MVYFIDASYIFFPPKLDFVLFQRTVSLAVVLQGSLGSRWTAPVRKLRLKFHFMACPLTTHPHSLNIFNHVCLFVCMCV